MTSELTYEVTAFNTATDSANKIHDDGVAQQYGFRGGLVPGVDVYAYLTRAAVEHYGPSWLSGGGIWARFDRPVYDGDTVRVTATPADDGTLAVELTDPSGTVCARARATDRPVPIERPEPGRAPLPDPRPLAGPDTLPVGRVLGTLSEIFDPARAERYLDEVRETLAVYRHGPDGSNGSPIAHPGWLLRFANSALSRSVRLGPWIHVESDVRLLGLVTPGQALVTRAVVLDELERKGHRFVTLDVLVTADDRPVERVTHTAIHTPRRIT